MSQKPPFPCGQTRREFLWQAGAGFTGTALTYLLAQDGFFSQAYGSPSGAKSPLAPKAPHFPAKAKACIFLFMYGGPSQMDLFDPKPELNKRHGQPMPFDEKDPVLKARGFGTLLGSNRTFKKYGQGGIDISDLYPKLATQADKLGVIRSCHAESFAHGSGLLQMNTGYLRQGYPSLGSWVTYGLGSENQNLPGFVVLLDDRGGPITGQPNWSSGFMPASFQGTQFNVTEEPVLNLKAPAGVSAEQQQQQIQLLKKLHQMRRETSEMEARIQSYELAFRMQASAPEAVDISKETEATKKLYGLDNKTSEPFGKRCLLARRLVERGVRFVLAFSGGGNAEATWDAHSDVDTNHQLHCAESDQPIAGLLQDLESRGLLDSTLVVWAGEFGRTPTSQNTKGRDHNPKGFTSWMAGGGIQGGQAIGATDELGFAAVDNKVHIHDLHATILNQMGLDHTLLTYFQGGRNVRLTDVHGRVVKELLRG